MPDEPADMLYVTRSKYRVYVMEELSEGLSYPSKIAEKHDSRLPNVSRALGELRERGLVTVVADEHPGRLYALTEYGERIWQRMEEEGLP